MHKQIENRRTYILVIAWAALVLLFFYSSAYALEAISHGRAERPEWGGNVFSEGSGSILKSEDMEEARSKAVQEAKIKAVLKVAGLYVSSEMLNKEMASIIGAFKPRINEAIEHYKIVSEVKGEDGFLRVKISAKVREDTVKDIIIKNLNDDRMIVITSEKNLGRPLVRQILEHELIRTAKGRGYEIVDYRTVKDTTVQKLVSLIRQGNTEAVKKLGIYYLTDIVVVGFVQTAFSEQTKDIYSAKATAQVKIHQIGSKREILSFTKHDETGFGSNTRRAGIDAIQKVSSMMSDNVKKSLPEKSVRKVTLRIKEIGSHASLQRAKGMLSQVPHVKNIVEGASNFNLEESTLYLKTTKGVDYIAGKLAEMKVFVIRKVSSSEIFLEARKI